MSNPSRLLILAYLGFISLGLPDPVAGVAWPSMRAVFDLPQSRFGLLFIGLGCGYCASGFFGGKLTQALGLGKLLWGSSALVAAAMFGSAVAPAWSVVVGCAVLWGLGSGGIDAGLNAFAAKRFSGRQMNWLHACYSIGATTGPLVMTAMVARLGSWRLGYAAVGGALLVMTGLFAAARRGWEADDPQASAPASSEAVGLRAALRMPLVWLNTALFFLYVGLEFVVGQWCFTLLTESRGLSVDAAGISAGAYYGAIGVGRILSGSVVDRIGADRMVRGALVAALAGTLLYALGTMPAVSCTGLVITGLGLAPIFPCLMSLTPQRLGTAVAGHAVGFQVSAGMLGAAVMPGAVGLAAASCGLEVVAQASIVLAVLLTLLHEATAALARRP